MKTAPKANGARTLRIEFVEADAKPVAVVQPNVRPRRRLCSMANARFGLSGLTSVGYAEWNKPAGPHITWTWTN